MNIYTQTFHKAQFPGYTLAADSIAGDQSFWWRRDIPVVDVDVGLDLRDDLAYVKQHHDDLFTEMHSSVNRRMAAEKDQRSWYHTEHAQGWEQCIVVGGSDYEERPIIAGTSKTETFFEPEAHPELIQNVLQQMQDLGIAIRRLNIATLQPGGWVQPHIDPKLQEVPPLSHFWIPMNDSDPSLKIWPYGYLHHQAGHIYLHNNHHWVHSAVNFNNYVRYVMLGLIEVDLCSQEFLDRCVSAAREQCIDVKTQV